MITVQLYTRVHDCPITPKFLSFKHTLSSMGHLLINLDLGNMTIWPFQTLNVDLLVAGHAWEVSGTYLGRHHMEWAGGGASWP